MSSRWFVWTRRLLQIKKESASVAISGQMSPRIELLHRVRSIGRVPRKMASFNMQGDLIDTSEAVYAPAAGRNKEPILAVLRRQAPQKPRPGLSQLFFLEVASGCGEHVGHFTAKGFGEEAVIWQPSDYVSSYFISIGAHAKIAQARERSASDIILQPVLLDVRDDTWTTHHSCETYWSQPQPLYADLETVRHAFEANKERTFDLVLNLNMIHISPPACTDGLFRGAASVLCPGGRLILYGPFKIGGQHTSESNVRFDQMLKSMDPEFGVRNLDTLIELATSQGLTYLERIPMPANNFTVVFEKQ